jgi:antitoxin component HigA of HigAB toxin-antitoxin module
MTRFTYRVLCKIIDWLCLKRAVLYLRLEAQEEFTPHIYPTQPEQIDKVLAQFGLTRESLAVRMGTKQNIDQQHAH